MAIRMRSKYEGSCESCGRGLPVGSEVWARFLGGEWRLTCLDHEEPGRRHAYPETHARFDRRLRGRTGRAS
jgi:hypothetical protein